MRLAGSLSLYLSLSYVITSQVRSGSASTNSCVTTPAASLKVTRTYMLTSHCYICFKESKLFFLSTITLGINPHRLNSNKAQTIFWLHSVTEHSPQRCWLVSGLHMSFRNLSSRLLVIIFSSPKNELRTSSWVEEEVSLWRVWEFDLFPNGLF